MNIEKFKLELALHGYILVQEKSYLGDNEYYCGIFFADKVDGHDRVLFDDHFNFSASKEDAFAEVYRLWTLKRNSSNTR